MRRDPHKPSPRGEPHHLHHGSCSPQVHAVQALPCAPSSLGKSLTLGPPAAFCGGGAGVCVLTYSQLWTSETEVKVPRGRFLLGALGWGWGESRSRPLQLPMAASGPWRSSARRCLSRAASETGHPDGPGGLISRSLAQPRLQRPLF